jgi:hypothetical protein
LSIRDSGANGISGSGDELVWGIGDIWRGVDDGDRGWNRNVNDGRGFLLWRIMGGVEVQEGDEMKAIVIMGNGAIIKKNMEAARRFYMELGRYLEGLGYEVSYDKGEPYTVPERADLWVGHSRGCDRLRFAEAGIRCVCLGGSGGIKDGDEGHWKLSDEKRRAIAEEDMRERLVVGNWISENVFDPYGECFFWSAAMAILFDMRLMRGESTAQRKEDWAHFWIEGEREYDPTGAQYNEGKNINGEEVDPYKNIDFIVGHKYFKNLNKGDRGKILRKIADRGL